MTDVTRMLAAGGREIRPWKESDAMDQRLQFLTNALSDRFTMTELCERYGLSRRIGYKWLARFTEDGKRGSSTAPDGRTRARRRSGRCSPGWSTMGTSW